MPRELLIITIFCYLFPVITILILIKRINVKLEYDELSKKVSKLEENNEEFHMEQSIQKLSNEINSIESSISEYKRVELSNEEWLSYQEHQSQVNYLLEKCHNIEPSKELVREKSDRLAEKRKLEIELQKAKHTHDLAKAELDRAKAELRTTQDRAYRRSQI